MNVDDIYVIEDYSPQTLRALAARVEKSTAFEQLIYRESELDEVWRLIDGDLAIAASAGAQSPQVQRLAALRELIVDAHDLIGNGGHTAYACDRLLTAADFV